MTDPDRQLAEEKKESICATIAMPMLRDMISRGKALDIARCAYDAGHIDGLTKGKELGRGEVEIEIGKLKLEIENLKIVCIRLVRAKTIESRDNVAHKCRHLFVDTARPFRGKNG
jgi:hypothetical protein